MHPYCVYRCELINIAAKHPQDVERAPLDPNTNYICLFLGKWPLSALDQCGHQRSEQYISAEKLVCHRAAHLAASRLRVRARQEVPSCLHYAHLQVLCQEKH